MNPMAITDIQRSQEKILDSFVGSRMGIVRHLYELTREPDAPDVFTYVAKLGDIGRFHFQQCGQITTGIGLTRSHAKTAAIGEAIERYCASFYDPGDIVTATFNEMVSMELPACEPSRFALYSNRQYQKNSRFPAFTENTKTGWVKGKSLTDSKEIWIPASFVFLPYRFGKDEVQVASQISTGMACAFDPDTAVMSAICEIVEREAIMIAWLQDVPFERIDPQKDEVLNEIFETRFLKPGFHFFLGRIPHDLLLYTVVAMVADEGRHIVATGSATKQSLREAAVKALLETVQVRELVKSIPTGSTPRFHIETYQNHERADALKQRFLKGGAFCSLNYGKNGLKELIALCKKAGLDVIMFDLTTPDVADCGLSVIRVVIPKAVPLSRDFQEPCLGGERIYSVPEKLGFRVKKENELNVKPHPFG